MRICSFGKMNKNIDAILPFLKRNLNEIPQEIFTLASKEGILKNENGEILPDEKLINFENISRDTIMNVSLNYLRILTKNLDDLKHKFSKSGLFSEGYTWDQMQHILIMALCIDHGILTHLYKAGFLMSETEDCYIWRFDLDFQPENAFGIKMWRDELNESAICELWHSNKKTAIVGVSDSEKVVIENLLSGLSIPKTLEFSRSLLLLKHYKMINNDKNIIVPIIDINRDNELIEFIQKISDELAEKALIPNLSVNNSAKYNHGIVRLVMESTVDLLIEYEVIDEVNKSNDSILYKWIFRNYSYSDIMKFENN